MKKNTANIFNKRLLTVTGVVVVAILGISTMVYLSQPVSQPPLQLESMELDATYFQSDEEELSALAGDAAFADEAKKRYDEMDDSLKEISR